MLASTVPYFLCAQVAGARHFMWLTYNLDDSCVYLSWMRQAADGSSHALNLFTTEPQHGMLLNPFFWVLGRAAKFTGLSLISVYQGARVVCGFTLLMVTVTLIRATVQNALAQRLAFLFVCFSSGLGWLPFWWNAAQNALPIDTWQPEAITFLSLYLSPLFCFSMTLQVAIVTLLFRGEQTGRARYAVLGGVCGLLLALTHTYDVLSLAAVWSLYLVLPWKPDPPFKSRAHRMATGWTQAIIASLTTVPGVAYIYREIKTESVFAQRAAVPTLTPPLQWVLIGFGLTLLLAIVGAAATLQAEKATAEPAQKYDSTARSPTLLLIAWAFANIAISYAPVAFQRKMLQGTHLPVSLLAGIGVAWILLHPTSQVKTRQLTLASVLCIIILSVTNITFVMRDIRNAFENRVQTGMHRPFINPGELDALQWIRLHTEPGTAFQPLPWVFVDNLNHKKGSSDVTIACFGPGLTGRPVYCGHWGETPHYGDKLNYIMNTFSPNISDAERSNRLRNMQVRYLLFSQKALSDTAPDLLMSMFRGHSPLPSYLKLQYSNSDADIYEIKL